MAEDALGIETEAVDETVFAFSHPALVDLEFRLSNAEGNTLTGWGNSLAQVFDLATRYTFIPDTEWGTDLEAARAGLEELKEFVSTNPDLENVIGEIASDDALFETITSSGNSEWLQGQLADLVPEGQDETEIPDSVREAVVSYLETQASDPTFRTQLQVAIVERNESFFDDVYTTVTSVAIGAGLNDFAERGAQHAQLVRTIQASPELSAAIDNLATSNPEEFGRVMANLASGEDTSPEAQAEAIADAQQMLSNPVLRGQLTEMINNIADDPNITDANLTEVRAAAAHYQETVEGMGLQGMFSVAASQYGLAGLLNREQEGEELNGDLTAARESLVQAYQAVGMSERDAHQAIQQGWLMGINDRIGRLDNLGNGLNMTVGAMINGIGSVLVSLGLISEEGMAQFSQSMTALFDNLNFDYLDNAEWAQVDDLPNFVEDLAGIDPENADDTRIEPEAIEESTTPEDNGEPEEYLGAELETERYSPISEIGINTEFETTELSGTEVVIPTAEGTGATPTGVIHQTAFAGPAAGVVMTPDEVHEVERTGPAVAANEINPIGGPMAFSR